MSEFHKVLRKNFPILSSWTRSLFPNEIELTIRKDATIFAEYLVSTSPAYVGQLVYWFHSFAVTPDVQFSGWSELRYTTSGLIRAVAM